MKEHGPAVPARSMPSTLVLSSLIVLGMALSSVPATSPLGEIESQVALTGITYDPGGSGQSLTGTAHLQLTLTPTVAAQSILIGVRDLQATGTGQWSQLSGLQPPTLTWTRGGNVETIANGSLSLNPGIVAQTNIDVPLQSALLHFVAVDVNGQYSAGSFVTGDAIRIGFGVPQPAPLDDGDVADTPGVAP